MLDAVTSLFSPPNNWWVAYAGIVGVLFLALQISAAVMVYFERKVSAWMQQRYGPTLVGPAGTLQTIADIVKLFFKEELQPKAADKLLFSLAPIISVATCFIAFEHRCRLAVPPPSSGGSTNRFRCRSRT